MNSWIATRVVVMVAVTILVGRATASANDDDNNREQAPDIKPSAVVVSVVPGFFIHGAGHWVAGDKKTAKKLLAIQGTGLAMVLLGGVPMLITGAAKYPSRFGIPLIVSGTGLLLTSWLSDVFGVSGGTRIGGVPRTVLPDGEAQAGLAYVVDPQFAYSSFAIAKADFGWKAWSIRPWVAVALDDDNQRVRTELAYRVRGAQRRRSAMDGSHLEVGVAAAYHRYGTERFSTLGVEVFAAARVDLARAAQTLRGAFGEFSIGIGGDQLRYNNAEDDLSTQLLAKVAFGMYLGRSANRGEVRLYYDHRRDDLAGGLALPRGGGFLGHFGIEGTVNLNNGWLLAPQFEVGSAYIFHMGFIRRFGETGPK